MKKENSHAKKIFELLEMEYKDSKVALDFKTPLQLLIATILSAQCTDERVNKVTKALFKKYKRAEDYANADLKELEEDIRPTGFYKNKAKSLKNCCKKIIEDFKGKIPDTLEELIALPGVGRKTANIVLGSAYGRQAIAVDTHVNRVSNRLGLADADDPDKIEEELCKIIPEDKWTEATHWLIQHGRRICNARKPLCDKCILRDYCKFYLNKGKL
ncbi:MAG: endonuclease III [Nitrospinae bacterium]|nr:endonuclease III [Nitrospinota bacterium]